MKQIVQWGFIALLVLGTPGAGRAQYVHIDFDHAPDGTTVAGGAVVNTLYSAAYGVTFDAVPCSQCVSDTQVYVSASCRAAALGSSPNVVTLYGANTCSPVSEHLGLIRATFAQLADSVCVHAAAVRSIDTAVLYAFDGTGTVIATAYLPRGGAQDICVSAPGIRSVTFAGGDLLYAWFDDLTVHLSGVTPARRSSWGQLKAVYR